MDRQPGLSVRLKLTLSYAGFLMLAGALLFAIVWVVVLRDLPDVGMSPAGPLVRSQLLRSIGGIPDSGLLELALYFLQPLMLVVVIKDTSSKRRCARRGL